MLDKGKPSSASTSTTSVACFFLPLLLLMPLSSLALLTRVVGCPLLCFILIVISGNPPNPFFLCFVAMCRATVQQMHRTCLCTCLFVWVYVCAWTDNRYKGNAENSTRFGWTKSWSSPISDGHYCLHATRLKLSSSSSSPFWLNPFLPCCHLFTVVLVCVSRWFGHLLLLFCTPRRADKTQ